MAKAVTVIESFLGYVKGQVIRAEEEIRAILDGEHAHHVVGISVPDDVQPPPEPAVDSSFANIH